MTQDHIEKLRELDRAATPGPWTNEARAVYGPEHPLSEYKNGRIRLATTIEGSNRQNPLLEGGAGDVPGDGKVDAQIIAEMRNALPELLKAYDERDALLRMIDSAKPCHLCVKWGVACSPDGYARVVCAADGFEGFKLRDLM